LRHDGEIPATVLSRDFNLLLLLRMKPNTSSRAFESAVGFAIALTSPRFE
jgi:hypothetical protein